MLFDDFNVIFENFLIEARLETNFGLIRQKTDIFIYFVNIWADVFIIFNKAGPNFI